MKMLCLKTVFFCIPFAVYALCCILVDPYQYFGGGIHIPDKEELAIKLNAPLWKALRAREGVEENVVFGNSKIAQFRGDSIQASTGELYSNLAFGGATLDEQINMFWIVSNKHQIKRAYFEVDLVSYNSSNRRDRVKGVRNILENPALYVFNFNVLIGITDTVKSLATSQSVGKTIITQTRDEFWSWQLNSVLNRYLDSYSFPADLEELLTEVKVEAETKGIELAFVFCPVHEDIYAAVYGGRYDLLPAKQKIIQLLLPMGNVIDADLVNSVTVNRDNFGDPFHMDLDLLNQMYANRIFADSAELYSDSLVRVYKKGGI